MTTIKNRPGVVTTCLWILVALHLLAAHLTDIPTVSSLLGGSRTAAWGLYASAAGATAIVGGFSGVLVVFAMSSIPTFARMRIAGADSLEANWLSTVASSIAAAGFCIIAALAALAKHGVIGAWIFELALLLATHASLRLLWLLSYLVTAVRRDDEKREREARALTFEAILGLEDG